MRVYELAKEYEIKATEFVDIIQSFGISVNSHMNGLDDGQVSDIRYKMSIKDNPPEIREWSSSPYPPEPEVVEPEPEPEPEVVEPEPGLPKVTERNTDFLNKLNVTGEQQVVIEKPKGFFGWIKGLFS
tara:strand:- start:4832 stop:5215 length:384 start_codon:yes stop_codon:yes gene_type:complete